MVITVVVLAVLITLLIIWKKTDFSFIDFIVNLKKPSSHKNNELNEIEGSSVDEKSLEKLNRLFKGEDVTNSKKDLTVGLIEVIKLPEWMETSSQESEVQVQEYYNKQFLASQNLIASCNEGNIPFGQALIYTDGSLKIIFWTLIENDITTIKIQRQLTKLNNLIQISYRGIETKTEIVQYNPLSKLTKENGFNKTVFKGAYLQGDYVKEGNIGQSMLDPLNALFRTEKKSGCLIVTNNPQKQKGLFHRLRKFSESKRYDSLVNETSNINSVKRKKQLDLLKCETKLKRLEAYKVSQVGFYLFTIGEGSKLEKAQQEANNLVATSKASLYPFLESDSSYPMNLYTFSKKDINNILDSLFSDFSKLRKYEIELLAKEAANIFRLPSKDTLPVTREQKTVGQISQPNLPSSGLPIGKLINSDGSTTITYNQNPNDLVLQTLVTGTTGSGKTSTLCAEVIRLETLGIKSLIIDPKGAIFPILREFLQDIRVFNFGKESVAPGRCNILECPDWMDVQTHLNIVESIFLSVWQIFPPMNMIIHRVLTRLFNTEGWSVKENRHGKNRTLNDFRKVAQQIMDEMGYSQKTHTDISSAMNMRIDYFTEGQIGKQLNCLKSIPIQDLLERTTVISLEYANNYAEKGVVLTYIPK